MTAKCPCCGVESDQSIIVSIEQNLLAVKDRSFRVSPRETLLLESLVKAMPGTARYARLIADLWPNPADEPAGGAERNLKVVVCGLRRILQGTIAITCVPGVGYRLDRTDAQVPITNKRAVAQAAHTMLVVAHAG